MRQEVWGWRLEEKAFSLNPRASARRKFSRATARDGAQHFPLLQRNLVRVLKKKRLAMLPQTGGD